MSTRIYLAALVLLAGLCVPVHAADDFIVVQSTTSTENSGLFKHILPRFSEATGIEVRVVAVGTGQAIKNARNGDGDVLLVHAKAAEQKFVRDGYGVERHDVMYNDFVIVGPDDDPAGLKGIKHASAALKAIATAGAAFISRGDDSGTHKKERSLWKDAGVDVDAASGRWYRETGSGMGATLNTAVGMKAYTLSDRGTWMTFGNKGELDVMVEGDPKLFNPYGVILVDPEKHPGVKAGAGRKFIDWLVGPQGQAAIASFKVNGEQPFYPNASQQARQ